MKYDAIIIGFGKGGKTLAGYLGNHHKQVALIEESNEMYGGTCINVGCIPSKSLVNSSTMISKQNLSLEERRRMYEEAIDEKIRVVSFLREKNYDKLAANSYVTIIDGFASFVDSHHISVKTASGEIILEGEEIYINTGSRPFVPSIKGIEDNPRVYFSETIMDLKTFPERLTIIGGGYIGMEFASMYHAFGSIVTVIQDGPIFLPKEDRDIADEIQSIFTMKGVNIILSAQVDEILPNGTVKYTVNNEAKLIASDAVLVATGRRPNVAGLHLENANVSLNERGAIKVDQYLRTSSPNIYALGDVNGGPQFTYVSLDDFRIIRDRLDCKTDPYNLLKRKNVPYSVFMTPALSRVGLTEAEAINKGYEIKIAKMRTSAVPKAQVLRDTYGFLKVVIDKKTDLILGAALLAEESYETINIVKLAMDNDLNYRILRDLIYTHPTMSEELNDLLSTLE